MKTFPVAERLRNPAIFSTAIALSENFDLSTTIPSIAFPRPEHRSATLTFVRLESRYFGITCHHVVKMFRKTLNAQGNAGKYSIKNLVGQFYTIQDRFVRPSIQFPEQPLDIAIREIHPEFPKAIGKEAMDLDQMPDPPESVRHAYAIGFPEASKRWVESFRHQRQMVLPQIQVLAELNQRPTRRFVMRSELAAEVEHNDFSGMSGGPIFWSNEVDEWGLLGIIYEGGVESDKKTVTIYGEIATPSIVKDWIAEVPPPSGGWL